MIDVFIYYIPKFSIPNLFVFITFFFEMKMKTFPIYMAFLVMGVADAMGPMSDAVRIQYELSNVMATLLSFFVFIAFAVFSVPGGLLAARILGVADGAVRQKVTDFARSLQDKVMVKALRLESEGRPR